MIRPGLAALPVRGLVAGSHEEVSPALRRFVRLCGASAGEREWREMGARSAAEAAGILQGQMLRQLSVASHAGHMRVLHRRLRYVGMSRAQAERAGGAQGIR